MSLIEHIQNSTDGTLDLGNLSIEEQFNKWMEIKGVVSSENGINSNMVISNIVNTIY